MTKLRKRLQGWFSPRRESSIKDSAGNEVTVYSSASGSISLNSEELLHSKPVQDLIEEVRRKRPVPAAQ